MDEKVKDDAVMEDRDFAGIGAGHVAYLRPMRSEEIKDLFPEVPDLPPGQRLWALFAADGMPILLTDSRENAEVTAMENDLEMVRLH